MLVGSWGGGVVNYGERQETPPLTHKGLWLHTQRFLTVLGLLLTSGPGNWRVGQELLPHSGAREGKIALGGSVSYEVTEWQRRGPPGSWLLLGNSSLRALAKLGTVK